MAKIEHMALYVRDLDKSADFFETYFQGKRSALYHNSKTGFSSYFLTFDGEARLEIMNSPDFLNEENAGRLGYAHVAFQVGSKEKVDELTAKMEKDGYTIKGYPRTTGDGYYESSVYDDAGNVIEITE